MDPIVMVCAPVPVFFSLLLFLLYMQNTTKKSVKVSVGHSHMHAFAQILQLVPA